MLKRIFLFLLAISLSVSSYGATNKEAMATYMVSTLVDIDPPIVYQKKVQALKLKRTPTSISAAEFGRQLLEIETYQRILNHRPEFAKRVRQFFDANEITTSAPVLLDVQNLLANILFLVEFQKMISERKDLPEFGADNIKNLNQAITQRLGLLHRTTEYKAKGTTKQNREIINTLKANFVTIGLNYEKFLPPSEQWINEFIGLDKEHVEPLKPVYILEVLTYLSTRKINLTLKENQCVSFFRS